MDKEERKETQEEMIRAMQEIFCKGHYKSFVLMEEKYRRNNNYEERQTNERARTGK